MNRDDLVTSLERERYGARRDRTANIAVSVLVGGVNRCRKRETSLTTWHGDREITSCIILQRRRVQRDEDSSNQKRNVIHANSTHQSNSLRRWYH
mmetsp:Transcript_20738/g.44849  ORF Transcript_20738/g.44849 Transcript_20738/m.44849 type:complete len:95 (-) Transcript_20738:367-651(-)